MAKGPNPMTLVAGVIAIVAIGLSVFMFLQVSDMKKQMGVFTGDIPEGLKNGEDATAGENGDGHGDSTTSAAIFNEKVDVTYALGEFSPNTADGKYAVMDITLVIESSYYPAEFAQYEGLLTVYQHDLEYFNDWNTGKIDKYKGTKIESASGDHASIPSGAIHAAIPNGAIHASVGPTELPAPELPGKPPRPLTALEQEISKNDSKVRDSVINVVNSFTSKDITNPVTKVQFKQALIDGINNILGDKFGKVVDLYFNKLIAT